MSEDAAGMDGAKHAPDAPGTTAPVPPTGMTLTFPAGQEDGVVPETVNEDSTQGEDADYVGRVPDENRERANLQGGIEIPEGRVSQKHFRRQFDELMKRLEDRFQAERVELEEKHSKELEEAMGYFSLSSEEREAKQQELQNSLLEDIGTMAQQLHDLTGALGPNDDFEDLTLPSDPQVLEQYANKMQGLEEQFQNEKRELERKHATEMEEALGTLKLSREQRDAKQIELQDQLAAEIGNMAKQLEDLNRAKTEYESKMATLKQQLTEKDKPRAEDDPNLSAMSRRLQGVEQERDAAQDELRRLKLALRVTHGDTNALGKVEFSGNRVAPGSNAIQLSRSVDDEYGLSPQERENVASLRGRIEQVERDVRDAAQMPGNSERMRSLRHRMEYIEKDLLAAEESTKEQYALDNIRARMERVENLLLEGEKAAHDWEALEELGDKINGVDHDLQAVEEAKKEYEALQTLRAKMAEVEAELKAAELLATNRENVERLRARLGQVEKELGQSKPSRDDQASIEKLLSRLNKAETSLETARKSMPKLRAASSGHPGVGRARDSEAAERDDEVENILARLAQAERKLNAAKQSAYGHKSQGYTPSGSKPQSGRQATRAPFDEQQTKFRSRLQDHFDDYDPDRVTPPSDNRSDSRRFGTGEGVAAQHQAKSKYEEPRPLGGFSRDKYYVEDVYLDRDSAHIASRLKSREAEKGVDELEQKLGTDLHGKTARPLRRRRGGLPEDQRLRPAQSMPYSSVPLAEHRKYGSSLEELRRHRAMLSSRLPTKGTDEDDEEEKKEPEAKYSFKEAIRNEERQRLRERMQPHHQNISLPVSKGQKSSGEEPNDEPPVPSVVISGKPEGSKGDPPSEARSVRSTSTEDAPGEKKSGMGRNIFNAGIERAIPASIAETEPGQSRSNADPPGSETKESEDKSVGEAPAKLMYPTTVHDRETESDESERFPSIHEETVKNVQAKAAPDKPVKIVPEPAPPNTEASKQRSSAAKPVQSDQRPYIQQTTVTSSKETRQALRDKDRTVRLFVYLMFLILVILAVVIVVVVILLQDDDDNNSPRATFGPSPVPRPSPLTPIPTTAPPSMNLITAPSRGPTQRPLSSPPNPPTSSTTPPISPSSLDGCPDLADDAPLPLDGVTREKSTVGSMYDSSRMGACGPIEDVGEDGVWYILVGDGESVQMNTCTIFNPNFDTQLLVYQQVEPTTGCTQGLACVAASDNFCGLQSSVSFLGERGRLYFVYVNGRSANPISGDPSEGDFSLTVSTAPRGSCAGAIGPLEIQSNDGQLPVIVEGTLLSGTFGVNPCNPGLATRTSEVWYRIMGNGGTVTASTCNKITEFPARLAVYRGNSCANLDCETAEDHDCGNGSAITWPTEEGVEYYLRVYSDNAQEAKFGLTVHKA